MMTIQQLTRWFRRDCAHGRPLGRRAGRQPAHRRLVFEEAEPREMLSASFAYEPPALLASLAGQPPSQVKPVQGGFLDLGGVATEYAVRFSSDGRVTTRRVASLAATEGHAASLYGSAASAVFNGWTGHTPEVTVPRIPTPSPMLQQPPGAGGGPIDVTVVIDRPVIAPRDLPTGPPGQADRTGLVGEGLAASAGVPRISLDGSLGRVQAFELAGSVGPELRPDRLSLRLALHDFSGDALWAAAATAPFERPGLAGLPGEPPGVASSPSNPQAPTDTAASVSAGHTGSPGLPPVAAASESEATSSQSVERDRPVAPVHSQTGPWPTKAAESTSQGRPDVGDHAAKAEAAPDAVFAQLAGPIGDLGPGPVYLDRGRPAEDVILLLAAAILAQQFGQRRRRPQREVSPVYLIPPRRRRGW